MAITRANLYNLTKKREGERKKEFAMRINETTPVHSLPVKTNKASERVRGAYGQYVPRVRPDNEALPRTIVAGHGLYDGAELRSLVRPGGLDFKALPSRGFRV